MTAIIAAVLSFLGALANGFGSVFYFSVAPTAKLRGNAGMFTVIALIYLAIAVVLVVGGIMLLRRMLAGRILIAVACAAVIALSIIGYFLVMAALRHAGLPVSEAGPAHTLRFFGNLIFPIVTMVLVLLPSTRQWCEAGRTQPYPPPAPWGSPPPAQL